MPLKAEYRGQLSKGKRHERIKRESSAGTMHINASEHRSDTKERHQRAASFISHLEARFSHVPEKVFPRTRPGFSLRGRVKMLARMHARSPISVEVVTRACDLLSFGKSLVREKQAEEARGKSNPCGPAYIATYIRAVGRRVVVVAHRVAATRTIA